jgi:hypothetical protein
VEPRQSEDGYEEEGDDDHDDDGDDCRDSLQLLCLLVIEDEDEAEDKDADHVKREGDEEHEEVAVVPPTYAIVDPGTVVVEDLDAVVADGAVAAARGTIKLAGDTPLHPHGDSVDLHVAVERGSEVIVPVFVRTGSGYHPWIHEGGHGEVDEDEEGDDPLEDGNRIPVLLQNVPLDTREVEEQGCGAQK